MNVLLPQGFMLGNADGDVPGLRFVLCSGGVLQWSADADGAPHLDQTPGCVFAQASMPGLPTLALPPMAPAPHPFENAPALPDVPRQTELHTPPATGPPTLV